MPVPHFLPERPPMTDITYITYIRTHEGFARRCQLAVVQSPDAIPV